MNEKQTKMLSWLVLVMLALVSFLTFVDAPDSVEEGDQEWHALIPDAKDDEGPNSANRIRIQTSQANFLVLLEEDGWHLQTAAGETAIWANQTAIEDFLTQFRAMQVGEPFPVGEPEPFGLTEDAIRITVVGKDGTDSIVSIGHDAAVGDHTYVQANDNVWATRKAIREAFDVTFDDLRGREVIRANPENVISITLRGPQFERTVFANEGGWWLRTSAGDRRANMDLVNTLVASVIDLRVETFGTNLNQPQPSIFGLDLVVASEDGDEVISLELGSDLSTAQWMESVDHPHAVSVNLSSLKPFFEAATAEWLSRIILPIRIALVEKIDLELGETTFSDSLVDAEWQKPATDAVINTLATSPAIRTDSAPTPGSIWGSIRLEESSGRVEKLTIHQLNLDGDRVVVDERGGTAFVLPNSVVVTLLENLNSANQSD